MRRNSERTRWLTAVLSACTVATLWTVDARADERTDFLFRLVRHYSAERRIQGPPGTFDGKIENLRFAVWALSTAAPPDGRAVTATEWGFVLHQLQSEGFHFDLERLTKRVNEGGAI